MQIARRRQLYRRPRIPIDIIILSLAGQLRRHNACVSAVNGTFDVLQCQIIFNKKYIFFLASY